MITIQNIIDWSKQHPLREVGRVTVISNDVVKFSIVGGCSGLYGNFIDTFELAIFNQETGEFITKFFCPDAGDDVLGYMPGEKLVALANQIFKNNDFQVR
jgi:hypothetical protein